MPFIYLVFLAVTQGITEFLPISSSSHLILVAKFFNITGRSLTLDVAMHVGTLGAVLMYLWRDIAMIVIGIFNRFRGIKSHGSTLFFWLVIGTMPVLGAGYILNQVYPDGILSIRLIAWTTFIFGVLLILADKIGMTFRRIEHLTFGDIICIGIAQAVALIPGTSRSGICMTAARILGMERTDAARFSMLLSIPVIIGAGSLKGYELLQYGNPNYTNEILAGAFLSFIVALLSIWLMMAWLRRANFTPFGIYRILLGGCLLGFSYSW